jgi:TolB-like protein
MAIWSSEIKELEKLYESIKGRLPDLVKELERLIKADDENMILLYSRRCLEVIITDLCECELKRPRKTEPLKGIIDKLHKEEKVPSHIISSMHGLNELSTYGAHPKDFDLEQVKPVLVNLDIIIKWYLEYKETSKGIKAKPTEEIRQEIKRDEDVRKSTTISRKRLAGILGGLIGIIASVFAVLYFSNIIGGGKQAQETDKSIAVIPFTSMSDDREKQYLADGVMDAILLHLSKIRDLRVIPRTSVEQYRKTDKTTTTICKELDVGYLLEGSFQKYGDNARLIVQLIKAGKEGHVWAKDYDRNWNDVLKVQSEVAQTVAKELYASITPEEKKLIEKIPTANLTAYDFYQKGREEHIKYWIDDKDREVLQKAEYMYHQALQYDSTYALAYTGLARVYWDKRYFQDYLLKNFMDSVLTLCDIALSYDNQLAEAYTLKGGCYIETGKPEQAVKEFDKAIKLNPNDWMAYRWKGKFYFETDWANYIYYLQKAASINRGEELPELLSLIGYAYYSAGFPEKGKQCYQDKLKLDGDSANYYAELTRYENWLKNFNKSIEFGIKGYAIDSTNSTTLINLGDSYAELGQYEESLKYYNKWIKRSENQGDEWFAGSSHRIGYIYSQNGNREAANYYFNKQINLCDRSIELGRQYAHMFYAYYDLAGVYAFRGDKVKAYENLRIFKKKPIMSFWMISLIKTDPLFSRIRNEPEFQQIARDVEAKYQAEHERVRKWLEETGQL